MNFKQLFYIIFIFLFISACGSPDKAVENETSIVISLSRDSSEIVLKGIPKDIIDEFKTDTISEKEWHSFFSVFLEPDDPDLRDTQKPLQGSYSVNDSTINFKPSESFKKGESYFVQCYARKIYVAPQDFIRDHHLPSRNSFQEVVFKF